MGFASQPRFHVLLRRLGVAGAIGSHGAREAGALVFGGQLQRPGQQRDGLCVLAAPKGSLTEQAVDQWVVRMGAAVFPQQELGFGHSLRAERGGGPLQGQVGRLQAQGLRLGAARSIEVAHRREVPSELLPGCGMGWVQCHQATQGLYRCFTMPGQRQRLGRLPKLLRRGGLRRGGGIRRRNARSGGGSRGG